MSEKLTGYQLALSRLPVDPAVGIGVRAALRGEPSAARLRAAPVPLSHNRGGRP